MSRESGLQAAPVRQLKKCPPRTTSKSGFKERPTAYSLRRPKGSKSAPRERPIRVSPKSDVYIALARRLKLDSEAPTGVSQLSVSH